MQEQNFGHALVVAIREGDEAEAARSAQTALLAGMDPLALVKDYLQPALVDVGDRFQQGELYLPELVLAGSAAAEALNVIKPQLLAAGNTGQPATRVVIGTIQGDLHDIGKNVVGALLAAHGFQVIDLGTDVTPKQYVEAAEKEGAQIIAISSLLTTSLPYHEDVVRLLCDTGRRGNHFVIVGGGPVNPSWASQIAADGYGRDARDAVMLCQALAQQDARPPLPQPQCFGALK